MKSKKWILLIVVLLAAALACSLGGGQNTGTNSTSVEATSPAQNTAPANSQEGTVPPENSEPQAEDFLSALNFPDIELTTPTEGVGVKPLFEWVPVEGAAWYGLVLKTADGTSYWAWMGAETSIYLGGVSIQPADNAAGPVLQAGMQWTVTAYGADGNLIAASSLRPISP